MKILMTAFEPFGNNQFNSTITALNNIDLENVTKLILPVTYPGAFQYLKSNLNIKPDFIILLGMAASREIITIEERAINNLSFKIPDNNNLIINNQKISLNNNEYLYSKMNIDDLINHLKKNLVPSIILLIAKLNLHYLEKYRFLLIKLYLKNYLALY